MKITFFAPDDPNIDQLADIDPDKEWKKLKRGQRWIVQTYLRLKNNGNQVHLSGSIPDEGVVVYHQRHKKILKKELVNNKNSKLITVCMRGDKSESLIADFEILQNDKWADGKRFFYIPYWPQPGLISRNKSRKNKVETIAFKGFNQNIHEYFLDGKWSEWIQENGMKWQLDSQDFYSSEENGVSVDWHDYANVDVIVAFRPEPKRKDQRNGFTTKPATKLYNAWHAGVPSILAPEYAYQQIRKTELDYIEVEKKQKVKKAILFLKNNPEIYQSMVENGLKRAEEFTVDRILKLWESFLYIELPKLIEERGFKMMQLFPLFLRVPYRRVHRYLTGRAKR